LQASAIPNPFTPLAGSYYGLAYDLANGVQQQRAPGEPQPFGARTNEWLGLCREGLLTLMEKAAGGLCRRLGRPAFPVKEAHIFQQS
jgi:hypothetical protein